MNRTEIIQIIKTHEKTIKSFGIDKIGIFGSYAKEIQNENSDIDILVKFKKVSRISRSYFGLKFYLEDLLKKEVDLCREKDLRAELKEEILRSVIYVS
ncbi:MAG: nucleotidyltransferase domain-containing protein [Psychrilyobacter sp.]|uniref:nucleotidyltransferase family protein n=1 Tax=Psychrilyobacter sp. TaxID=2586924 RepID=UPI003C707669